MRATRLAFGAWSDADPAGRAGITRQHAVARAGEHPQQPPGQQPPAVPSGRATGRRFMIPPSPARAAGPGTARPWRRACSDASSIRTVSCSEAVSFSSPVRMASKQPQVISVMYKPMCPLVDRG